MDQNIEVYQQEDFDFDSIVLRRADPDDCDQIMNLVEIGKDDVYNRVYSYPKILKIIETAYLSITVLDREGHVVAFAAFEDFPQGLRGMYDEKHYNCWEVWFQKAFQVEEFTPFNTLWLTYFIAGGSISYKDQKYAFKKILQTAYTSVPDIIGILFLMRGDADEDDLGYCFDPLSQYFEEVQCKQREVLKDVRGIHFNSKVFFSSRVLVLPFIEIRLAKEEDHDDLADVFNSQSETVTEAYGEYFLAELIAAAVKSDNNKALVAQVKDKAVGLMGLTSEVDVKLLHQCFDLDSFDNLLKPEFMNAVRNRREYILEERRKKAEQERLEELQRLKEETMKCNIIAQRIALQEFIINKESHIQTKIEDILQDDETAKSMDAQKVEELFDSWLEEFKLTQPSDYFIEHPTDDYELACNIQTEKEFMLSTLEIFGLPEKYMDGNGHFPDWGKEKKEDKMAAAKKRALASKMKNKKTNAKMEQLRKEKGRAKKNEEEQRPTHFDLAPYQKALKRFIQCNGEARSKFRQEMKKEKKKVKEIFVDKYGKPSFKKCINIQEFDKKLAEKKINLEPSITDNIGPMLICFGDINYQLKQEERMPEESEEEKRAAQIKKLKEEEEKKAAEGGDQKKSKKDSKKQKTKEPHEEEEKKEEKPKEPPKPIKVWLYETSIHDLLLSIAKMLDYDYVLYDLGILNYDITEERSGNKKKEEFEEEEEEESKVEEVKEEEKPVYSSDYVYNQIVQDLEDLDTIPTPPDKAKNTFAITLFCMEAAFDSRSKDFLKYAFDQFPDRDYLIVTQPHTVNENSLLQKFTLAQKKSENTFSHVLYIIHRDSLLEQDIAVSRTHQEDFDSIVQLLEIVDEKKQIIEDVKEATVNPDSQNLTFVARIEDQIVGVFVMAKDVNLDYYKSHFHIQDSILMSEHERKGHTRLIHSVLNPIFNKSTRFILKELLRLSANTCLYFEIHDTTIIPTLFHELVHLRLRRFPHFLDRKWDHERFVSNSGEEEDGLQNGFDRDHLDEEESKFALCFTTKRLLSEPKIVKNSRIVIVGASDTGISFIEALLSISYLQFNNIVLISPGGLPHQHLENRSMNLKASSTSYTYQELKRLMLESRVKVINARMVDIDRSDKNVILNDETIIPYDTLILTMGIQDKTLNCLGYVSRGIAPLPQDKKRVEGLMSIDDPYLYQHLRPGGTLISLLTNRRRPQTVVVYGRTLHAYTCVQGLLSRGVKSENIILVLPGKTVHVIENYDDEEELDQDINIIYPPAFPDEYVEQKIWKMLDQQKIRVVHNAQLMEITADEENQLDMVLFKLLDIPDEEEEEDELEGIEDKSENIGDSVSKMGSNDQQSMADGDIDKSQKEEQIVQKKKRKKNELEIECKVLITAGHRDIDQDVFNAIHNNGLVYNGRLIVDKNFQTTDPSIFASGSLCEFSGRYKALSQGRPLRMDRYNGREMGSRLARSVFDIYDPSMGTPNDPSQTNDDELPTFYLPQGQGGILPQGLIYYNIETTNMLQFSPQVKDTKNRKDLLCDNVSDDTYKGHFIRFSFNSIGLIDSVTYIGSEEVILQSLWSFVGLHENYLNLLTQRYDNGIIPNVAQFLSENWAIALYHEWFGDFCLRMRQSIQGLKDVQVILEKAFDMTKSGEGIKREQFAELKNLMDPKTIKMIEDETLEFVRVNMNHLPMYYIPGEEFP